PKFVYNYLSLERYDIASPAPLPKGKAQIKVNLVYGGKPGELGKGATVTMTVNGSKVAEGQLPKTIPQQISIGEGLDVGEDIGSPVDFTYKPPFQFTGNRKGHGGPQQFCRRDGWSKIGQGGTKSIVR